MTSLTIIVPDWLAWVVVGALVVNTGLTIVSLSIRIRVNRLLRRRNAD